MLPTIIGRLWIMCFAKLLILDYLRQEKRRPETSSFLYLVEAAGLEPASRKPTSKALHA